MADTLSDAVTVTVHGLSSSGEGVGRLADGRTVFVPWTMPGDRVTVRVVRERPRWVRAELVSVDEPAERRTEPPCPYFGTCGGCAFQHVPYEQQVVWKGRFLTDALRRLGGIPLDTDVPVQAAPRPYGYRSRVTFTAVRRRGRTFRGLRQWGRPGRVVDIETCLLADPAVTRVWHGLREMLDDPRVLAPGTMVRVTVRAMAEGVAVVWSPRCPLSDPEDLAAFGDLAALEDVVEVWEDGPDGPRRLWGRADASGAPTSDATEVWFGAPTPVPAPAFTQVNRAMGEVLLKAVTDAATGTEVDAGSQNLHVIDAYAGISLIGRRLAAGGARVTAIEREHWAVEAARRDGGPGLEVLEGDVEAHLPRALPADVVVLNPPRAGISESVAEVLARSGPPRIFYVSCDPATLARDLARLSPAYELNGVRGFDLFPQTPHVEALVDLRRREADIDAPPAGHAHPSREAP